MIIYVVYDNKKYGDSFDVHHTYDKDDATRYAEAELIHMTKREREKSTISIEEYSVPEAYAGDTAKKSFYNAIYDDAADMLSSWNVIPYYTADRETGTFIDEFYSLEDAKKAISEYEDEDKRNGEYTPDFYDIVNADHESIRE